MRPVGSPHKNLNDGVSRLEPAEIGAAGQRAR